ncbi:MAG: hypothetical protein M1839_003281 [Geoglossum umbratile]|nr:MAG: hypothetical protein M1839_003281 [Geoglossum umbratile]
MYTTAGVTTLHLAAGRGDVIKCYALMDSIFVDHRDSEGSTPLHYAAWYGQLGTTRLLVEYGADIYAIAQRYPLVTPMGWALSQGFSDVVEYLTRVAASPKQPAADTELGSVPRRSPDNMSAADARATSQTVVKSEFHLAAQRGEPRRCLELLSQGECVDCRDENGETPLHFAAWYGSLTVTCILVARGADINATSQKFPSGTPLRWAMSRNHYDIMKFLVDMGARA